MIRTLVFSVAIAAIAVVSSGIAQDAKPVDATLAVSVPSYKNEVCPIMGNPASEKSFVDTSRGRIHMCCGGCAKKILQDPDTAYAKAFPATKKAANTVCPVSGEAIPANAPTVTLQGHEINVCCAGCIKLAAENALIVVTRALNKNVVDMGNLTCPVTDKPVANNAFCLVGEKLIRLSSQEAVDAVRKDPAKAVEKAKEIRAAQLKAGIAPKGTGGSCCESGEKKEKASGGSCCGGDKKSDGGCCGGGAEKEKKAESRKS